LLRDDSERVRFQAALTLPAHFPEQLPPGEGMGSPWELAINEIWHAAKADLLNPRLTDAYLSAPSACAPILLAQILETETDRSPELLDFVGKLLDISARNPKDRADGLWIGSLTTKWQDPRLIRSYLTGVRRAGLKLADVDKGDKLSLIFSTAASTASDAKAKSAARLEALSLLSLTTLKQAQPALLACLAKDQPEAIQSAAVSALGQFNAAEVTTTLLDHWPDLTTKARTAALTELLSRPDRTIALLKKVDANTEAFPKPSDFSPAQIQSLLKSENKAIANLAKTALASVIPPSRESVLATFQPALATKGDMAKGQLVFLQRCIACHRAAGQGIQVGPDFVTVKTKGKDALMTAILDPHKEVAPQFIAYTVNTKDGQTLAGIVTKDDASSMTIKIMGGAEINLPRSNIKGSTSSGQSLMPEGIEAGMTVQDMADLLEFIEKAN
jgi:putative heme-binding domain-containing protein